MTMENAENTAVDLPENDSPLTGEKMLLPVIEEQVTLGKQVVETGKVIISKKLSEHEQVIDAPLLREEIRVERVPLNLFVEEMPPVRQEGDVMIIPVVEEQIVVQKKLLLVEEIRVKRDVVEHRQPQTITVLKEEVEIRRVSPDERADDSIENSENFQTAK